MSMQSESCDVTVIIPTLQESNNLPELIERVARSISTTGLSFEIIIVDDNSSDGTEETCRNLREIHPLRLHTRINEKGLSSAVIVGMKLSAGKSLLVMDGDLSHPPESIPALLRASGPGRIVIGSRYMEGGEIHEKWSLFRKLLSRMATLLAGPLTPVSDPMSGFFVLPRASFFSVAEKLNPVGYKILLELIVKLDSHETAEVPISFCERKWGKSKLSPRQQGLYLLHLCRLYAFRLRRFIGFT